MEEKIFSASLPLGFLVFESKIERECVYMQTESEKVQMSFFESSFMVFSWRGVCTCHLIFLRWLRIKWYVHDVRGEGMWVLVVANGKHFT